MPWLHVQCECQALSGCATGGVVAAPAAARVNAVGQHDRERARLVVDDDRGTGVSRVTRGRRARQAAHVPTLVQLEAQAMGVAGEGQVLVGGHLGDTVRRQDAVAGVGAAVEQALGEHRHVRRRGEDTGVTGDAAERPRVLVVDFSPDDPAGRAGLELGRGDPGLEQGIGVVAGVLHLQRIRDPLSDELVESLAGLPLEQDAESDQVEVAVDILGPRRRGRRDVQDRRDPRRLVRPPAPQRHPWLEPRRVRQKLTHRDGALAVGGERREVGRHRFFEPDGTALDLLHHQD